VCPRRAGAGPRSGPASEGGCRGHQARRHHRSGRVARTLPLQTLVDRDGEPKTALRILVEEALSASIEEICVVVAPGDEAAYAAAAGPHRGRLRFVVQDRPAGYGHAVHCAREFARGEPFLLMRLGVSRAAA
jgi:UTP--glucose-1-phosphate uridylyltransferase